MARAQWHGRGDVAEIVNQIRCNEAMQRLALEPLDQILTPLTEAVCFEGPPEFRLYDIVPGSALVLPLGQRLPFPTVALCFDGMAPDGFLGKRDSSRVYPSRYVVVVSQGGPKDAFCVMQSYWKMEGKWYPPSFEMALNVCSDGQMRLGGVRSLFDVQLPDFKSLIHDQKIETGALASMLAALSCKNVEAVKHEPPIALNRSRAKTGRAPLPNYYSLEVGGSPIGAPTCKGERQDGFKVRQHYRRGHIRRTSGGNVWVTNTIVATGSPKGEIHKGYSVRA